MKFSKESNIHIGRYHKFIFSRPKREYIIKSGLVKHHIVPKSMGGSNEVENISILTVREHYIAHLILWKAYGSKMARAFWLLANIEGRRITSRQYESLKSEIFMSEETRLKMSNSRKGVKIHLTSEQRKNKSRKTSEIMKEHYKTHEHPRGNLGKKHSEETKKRLSENHKGLVKSEETRSKLSDAHFGKVLSEEHKERLSIAASKRTMTEKTRLKMSESAKNKRPMSKETKIKISEASKIREMKRKEKKCISSLKGKSSGSMQKHVRQKISEANKGKKKSEETKSNMKNAWIKRRENKKKELKENKIEF